MKTKIKTFTSSVVACVTMLLVAQVASAQPSNASPPAPATVPMSGPVEMYGIEVEDECVETTKKVVDAALLKECAKKKAGGSKTKSDRPTLGQRITTMEKTISDWEGCTDKCVSYDDFKQLQAEVDALRELLTGHLHTHGYNRPMVAPPPAPFAELQEPQEKFDPSAIWKKLVELQRRIAALEAKVYPPVQIGITGGGAIFFAEDGFSDISGMVQVALRVPMSNRWKAEVEGIGYIEAHDNPFGLGFRGDFSYLVDGGLSVNFGVLAALLRYNTDAEWERLYALPGIGMRVDVPKSIFSVGADIHAGLMVFSPTDRRYFGGAARVYLGIYMPKNL